MINRYLILFSVFFRFSLLFGEIADWEEKQLQEELSSIELSQFHPKKIARAYYRYLQDMFKQNRFRNNMHHIQICEDRSIFINGNAVERLNSEIAKLMRKFRRLTPLPICSFLFTRNGECITNSKYLKDVPILVGSKFFSARNNQILFIEDCSTIDNGRLGIDWCASDVYAETIRSRVLYEWSEKIPRLIWRGFLSDLMHCLPMTFYGNMTLNLSPRMKIHILSHFYPELIDAKVTNVTHTGKRYLCSLGIENLFSLEGEKPVGLHGSIVINPRISIEEQVKYRYQIALDGIHATNPGYAWRLLSGCLVFKQDSPYSQWFYAGLTPYVHFVPVKKDLSDLLEKVEQAIEEDTRSQQIGEMGKKFAEEHLVLSRFFEHALYVLKEYTKKQEESKKVFFLLNYLRVFT